MLGSSTGVLAWPKFIVVNFPVPFCRATGCESPLSVRTVGIFAVS